MYIPNSSFVDNFLSLHKTSISGEFSIDTRDYRRIKKGGS